ncbi:hypothetical protein Q9Q94_12890 [Uliginosibacterium sp. 31-16]|uniref:hypothetical protein n=1 Tax=Uliginosibacterium sp. 31-16 TaxID=3068315 RepID=UPI00273D8CC6|nr:hypothetical protein [Uliginosibacterium sp. 31-16]MDP5240432.1 hypothetical protein [Uliginosibacterium sp. 31-16]
MEQEYRIVFNGRIREGLSMRKVRANAAIRLNASEQLIERMFSGKRVVMKNNVSKDAGIAYMELLGKLGLVVELEPVPSPKDTATAPSPISAGSAGSAGSAVLTPPVDRVDVPNEESWMASTCLADLARTQLNLDRAEALLNGCLMPDLQDGRMK